MWWDIIIIVIIKMYLLNLQKQQVLNGQNIWKEIDT
jgi:hypothetical protein